MFEKKIVQESSSTIRAIARDHLRGNWGRVVVGLLILEVMTSLVPDLLACISTFSTQFYNEVLGETLTVNYLSSLYGTFLTGAFEVGACAFLLAFFRYKDANPGYIFDGFNFYIKTLLLTLVMGIFVVLWFMLLIVPGIIALFRYSQAYVILADDPTKGVMQCIRESKELMIDNKFKLFCLEFSFIGWAILASIPSGVLQTLSVSGVPAVIFGFIADIPIVFLAAYQGVAAIAFYEIASGRLVARFEEETQDFNF